MPVTLRGVIACTSNQAHRRGVARGVLCNHPQCRWQSFTAQSLRDKCPADGRAGREALNVSGGEEMH